MKNLNLHSPELRELSEKQENGRTPPVEAGKAIEPYIPGGKPLD